jgi:hypothetical protein
LEFDITDDTNIDNQFLTLYAKSTLVSTFGGKIIEYWKKSLKVMGINVDAHLILLESS